MRTGRRGEILPDGPCSPWSREPWKTRHLKLGSTTLRAPQDVKMWAMRTGQRLLEAVEYGPIVVE